MPERDPERVRAHLAEHHTDPLLRELLARAFAIAIPWTDHLTDIATLARRYNALGLSPAQFVARIQLEGVGQSPRLPTWIGFPDGGLVPDGADVIGYLWAAEGTWLFIARDTHGVWGVQAIPLAEPRDIVTAVHAAYPRLTARSS